MENIQNKIPPQVRKDIMNGFEVENIYWLGRFKVIEFLKDTFDLKEIESSNPGFLDALVGIHIHVDLGDDWDDNWIFTDERFDLENCPDTIFLKFLCNTIHPKTQREDIEIEKILNFCNESLNRYGFQIKESETKIGTKYKYNFLELKNSIIETPKKIKEMMEYSYINENIEKCNKRIEMGEYSGAATLARTLLESTLKYLYEEMFDNPYEFLSIQDLYKKIAKKLNIHASSDLSDDLKKIVGGMSGVVSGIGSVRNKAGDSHGQSDSLKYKIEKHHAILVVNAAQTITYFLIDVYENSSKSKTNKSIIK